jgi:hypothetical protein
MFVKYLAGKFAGQTKHEKQTAELHKLIQYGMVEVISEDPEDRFPSVDPHNPGESTIAPFFKTPEIGVCTVPKSIVVRKGCERWFLTGSINEVKASAKVLKVDVPETVLLEYANLINDTTLYAARRAEAEAQDRVTRDMQRQDLVATQLAEAEYARNQ